VPIEADPNSTDSLIKLANALAKAGRKPEARALLDQAFKYATLSAPILLQLGNEYVNIGDSKVALALYEQALELDPAHEIPILLARTKIYASQEKWDLALVLADEILERDPNHLDALYLEIQALDFLARTDEEVAILRRMISLKPDPQLHSVLSFYMLYAAATTPESVYAESRRWFALYGEVLRRNIQPHRNNPDPTRKIKIAYLSPDLREHTIMKLLPAVFENHDQTQFDVSFYSIGSMRDKVTAGIAKTNRLVLVRPFAEDIAAQTRADKIDILVDLAGHTMEAAAYLVFAMKPAPVQVSWLGAVGTTGMPTMDYYIGDAYQPCPGTEHLFAETVYRLPRISESYRPTADIGMAQSPFFKNGFITFGSFNDPRKITRDVIKLWAVILHMTPSSKLFFKFFHLEKPICHERLRNWLLEDGIPAERFRFEGASPPLEYLSAWSEVDIGLDPFPYNGSTTTMDALWMGVPVVTLAGRLAVSCCGATILSAAGLPVSYTVEEYIQTALFLVDNIPRTPEIRRRVRQAIVSSALMDEKGLIRAVESAYREMWMKWCRSSSRIGNAV
jgi:predicted O-linked N-acetylglucosamine transferase (SPINDLY family)